MKFRPDQMACEALQQKEFSAKSSHIYSYSPLNYSIQIHVNFIFGRRNYRHKLAISISISWAPSKRAHLSIYSIVHINNSMITNRPQQLAKS